MPSIAIWLVRAAGYLIRQRGETPFLHTGAANTRACRTIWFDPEWAQ